MADPPKVTLPLLDALEVLRQAFQNDTGIDGWMIVWGAKRTSPNAFAVLDRLEDAGWITGSWDQPDPGRPGKPPLCLYRLTSIGVSQARELLTAYRRMPAVRLRHQTVTRMALRLAWPRFGGAR